MLLVAGTTVLLLLPCLVFSAPLPAHKMPSEDTVSFMKRFGYVTAGPETDALYTEEGFKIAVRQMQKFGGLPETGELDEETLKLITAPRCGVPDIIRQSNSTRNRTKRYIIGSNAWRKKRLTYFLANWPPELESDTTVQKLRQAFEMWSDITPLKFEPLASMNADMIVAFGRSAHGDGYPFDGTGGILAHAFFPYEHGPYGGDIHFDDDENWIDGSKDPESARDGVDFFTVATHEIGHSLGLAHSTVPGSIMFPYYKGYKKNMRMDYDDIVAMYDMYVIRGNFEDEDVAPIPTESANHDESAHEPKDAPTEDDGYSEPNETPTDRPEYDDDSPRWDGHDEADDRTADDDMDNRTTSNNDFTEGYQGTTDLPNEEENPRTSTIVPTGVPPTRNESTTAKPKRKIPDLCEGSIDAIDYIRGELFVFKGLFVWRMPDLTKLTPGYPVYFHNFFRGFPWSVRKIDAVYQRIDYNIVFFTGPFYWVFNGNEFLPDSPKPLTDLGLPSDVDHVDAALVWAKNKKTYLFSGELYWRFSEEHGKVEPQYPQRMSRWRGIPQNLDGAFTWKDGYTYFFKGKDFWRFNNQNISADADFPLPTAPYWFDCIVSK